MLDNEQSQRVVDFLSGATHAIDGHQQRIGEGVFLFAPANVMISSESSSSKAIKDAFWTKTNPV
jgi:cell division inhibitor SepF